MAEVDAIPVAFPPLKYPIISISYCVKCKWGLRANWYVQEILQTFTNGKEGETFDGSISLNPSQVAGTFQIMLLEAPKLEDDLKKQDYTMNAANWSMIFDRKLEGGFPDSKLIKQRIKALLFPNKVLNHVDKPNKNNGLLISEKEIEKNSSAEVQEEETVDNNSNTKDECIECKRLE